MRIILDDYNEAWAADFAAIRDRIVDSLGEHALAVEHVGSTAIPGLCAKPVIDVLLVVSDSADESSYGRLLELAGFEFHVREPAWHEHRLFKLASPEANIHIFSSGCPEIDRMIAFRDLLQSNAAARLTYEAAKRDLAQRDWTRVQEYADAKSSVVETVLRQVTGADELVGLDHVQLAIPRRGEKRS